MYSIKTRNWNCKKWVLNLLNITLKVGVKRVDSYGDGDGKFFFTTSNFLLAWIVWGYFMLLSRWSGGWTYIIRPCSRDINLMDYKSIY